MNQPLEKSLSLDNVDISASLIIDESDVENFNQKTTTDVANNDYPVSAYYIWLTLIASSYSRE
jgi:hypothetical protein